MNENIDKLAEEVYDWCCSHRVDNMNKDGSPGDPRKVGCPYCQLYDNAKNFYRNIVIWSEKFGTMG